MCSDALLVIGMTDDECSIRDLVATWFAASRTGNLQAVVDLMTDDVIFMVPGSKPFGRKLLPRPSRV